MSRIYLLAAAICSFLLAGCHQSVYVLELTPDDAGVHRKLTVWRATGPKSEHLQQIYGAAKSIENGKHVFEGRFSQTMPADISGYGRWVRYESPLGNVTGYSERFRGSDDLQQQLADRQVALDRLVDLTIAWFRSEMKGDPHQDRVEQFLDEELRRDLKNLAIYVWMQGVVADEPDAGAEEVAFRLLQYFEQRGYWGPTDLPRLLNAMVPAEGNTQEQWLLREVQRTLARKIGIPDDQPIPQGLAFLGDAKYVERSLEAFCRQTDEYRQAYERWRQEHPDKPESDVPEAMNVVVGELVVPIYMQGWQLGFPDHLEVRLNLAKEPYQTNGRWDAEAHQVIWEHRLPAGPLPAFSYAVWSEPDTAAQQARFGRTLLTDAKLARYVMWYCGLDDEEKQAWDAFIQASDAELQLRARIELFRFPQEDEDSAPLSDIPRSLLLAALDAD
ncbi:MAG: hypothetical protein EA424_05685 [Planctomycetaceae bacterium]|nr:MAG: hypothetical protein EA424_05685 [Planctomycetaceae bacterium]